MSPDSEGRLKSDPARRYPHLLQEVAWHAQRCVFELGDSFPPRDYIANINIVPHVDAGWVVLRLAAGSWELPGGTLEPGETPLEALKRELLEEAGARLLSFTPLGAWRCRSMAERPYRPHLPYPMSYRVAGYGRVALLEPPRNPGGQEWIAAVEVVSLEEARRRFEKTGRPELAELYALAGEMRAGAG